MFVWMLIQTTVYLNLDGGFDKILAHPNPSYTYKTKEECEKRVAWELEYGATLERKNGNLQAIRYNSSSIDFYECHGAALFK